MGMRVPDDDVSGSLAVGSGGANDTDRGERVST